MVFDFYFLSDVFSLAFCFVGTFLVSDGREPASNAGDLEVQSLDQEDLLEEEIFSL